MMEGVNSSMIYLIHYKNFCKCRNVPPAHQQKIKEEKTFRNKNVYKDGARRGARKGDGSRERRDVELFGNKAFFCVKV
jgi:hypothetical protein